MHCYWRTIMHASCYQILVHSISNYHFNSHCHSGLFSDLTAMHSSTLVVSVLLGGKCLLVLVSIVFGYYYHSFFFFNLQMLSPQFLCNSAELCLPLSAITEAEWVSSVGKRRNGGREEFGVHILWLTGEKSWCYDISGRSEPEVNVP